MTAIAGGGAPAIPTIAVDSVAANVASMTITFDKAVTGFVVGDITVNQGSLASFAGSGTDYTVDWTLASGSNTMDIAADVVNEGNTAATQKELGYLVSQPDGSVTDIDTTVISSAPDTNYASYPALNFRQSYILLIKFDLSSISGAVWMAQVNFWLNSTNAANQNENIYRILAANSAWTTTAATWNYALPSSVRWAGDTGGDGGVDAGCSQSGTDYSATVMGTVVMAAADSAGHQYTVSLNLTEFGLMVAGNYGMRMNGDGGTTVLVDSSNSETASERPKLEVVYEPNP